VKQNYIAGLQATLDAFSAMQDKDGKRWKRNAMSKAGREAMKIVVKRAKLNAPVGKHGILKRNITVKGSFRHNRRKGQELDVHTTYGKAFETAFAKKRPKDKIVRYPYIIEAGWKASGNRPAVKSNPYQKNALKSEYTKAHRKFASTLKRALDLYADNVGKRSFNQASKELKMMQASAFYRGGLR